MRKNLKSNGFPKHYKCMKQLATLFEHFEFLMCLSSSYTLAMCVVYTFLHYKTWKNHNAVDKICSILNGVPVRCHF